MDITIGSNTKIECVVKNTGSVPADVKLSAKNDAWSTANGYKSGLASATIDDVAASDVSYGAFATIPAGGQKKFVLVLDTTLPSADKFVVSLNSESSSTASEGSITISNAYMY